MGIFYNPKIWNIKKKPFSFPKRPAEISTQTQEIRTKQLSDMLAFLGQLLCGNNFVPQTSSRFPSRDLKNNETLSSNYKNKATKIKRSIFKFYKKLKKFIHMQTKNQKLWASQNAEMNVSINKT